MIFVPWARFYAPTFEALARTGYAITPVPLGDDEDAYRRYYQERWRAGTSFISVEHDVVPQPGQIEGLIGCKAQWCCCPEEGGSPSLSLVRFRAGFIRDNPRLWDDLAQHPPVGQRPRWSILDSWLTTHADREPHCHRDPPTLNARPWGSLH